MRKIFKKAVAIVAAAAMMIGSVVAMPTEAKAAAPTEVYLVGSLNGWNADDPIDMVQSGNTWSYTYNVTTPSNIDFKILVNGKGWGKDKGYADVAAFENVVNPNDGNMRVECGNTGDVTFKVTFNDDGSIAKMAANGTALGAVVLPDEYYVVGSSGLCNPEWGNDDFAGAKQLTEKSSGVWSYTFEDVAAGKHYYNVIQLKSWDNKLKDSSIDVDKKSDVTFTYTKATGEVTVTITPVEDETQPPTTEAATTTTEAVTTTTEAATTTTEAATTTTEAATTTTEAATTTTEAATTTTEAATTTTEAAITTTETATTTASNETTGATTTASNETTGATTTTTVTNETSGETEVTTTVKEDSKTKEVNVRVKLDSSLGWEKVCLYVWDENGANIAAWPGTEMTKDGQYYTAKVTVPAGVKINMIVNNGNGGDNNQTKDLENIDISSGSVEISLAADLTATVTPVTGDTIMILPVVVAMLALGCVVVALNAKKANR